FPLLIESQNKPSLEKGISGLWLLAVVATQAVSVLGCLVAPRLGEGLVGPALFTALSVWPVRGGLSLLLIGPVFYPILFPPLPPQVLPPPYWINMGAVAISTLAGASLVREAGQLAILGELLPFLKGFTLLFWATATWWIPLLLVLGAWRHISQRFPLRYEHGYWAAVFPLGMYTLCTHHPVRELDL